MSKFWIGTLEDYNQGVADEVKLDETVKKHASICSPDGKEVLVKGLGGMALDEVKAYQSENWHETHNEKLPE